MGRTRSDGLQRLRAATCRAEAFSARVLRLEGEREHRAVRFLSGFSVCLEEGKRTSWVTITRTGRFYDKRYGDFEISREMLLSMVSNFEKRTYGQDIFLDKAHRPSEGAAAKVLKLEVQGDRLRAMVEWTPFGIELVTKLGFQYLSAEYVEDFCDNEKGSKHGPLLLGAGLVTRPVIKHLDPIELSELEDAPPTLLHPELTSQLLQEIAMKWKQLIEQMDAALVLKKLAESVRKQFADAAAKALEHVADEAHAKAIISAIQDGAMKLAEQAPPGAPIEVRIDLLGVGAKSLSEDDVKKLMEAETKRLADAGLAAAATLAEKRKLLTDTIAAAKDLDDATKKELGEQVLDLVSSALTDDQVKRLAEAQIANANKVIAAKKLSSLGYQRQGSAHITVDDSNAVKRLQEEADKRLGITSMSDAKRFDRVGGQLPEVNKAFAAKALAQFDEINGRRLHDEAKRLAAGDGVVADVAVPASFERTVIREALYNLVGLSLVNADTANFAAVCSIPYSFRDTTAAGTSGVRRYEGQAILRAGVKQALYDTRPTPQKIAFEVSDEIRYLAGNGQLNWDVLGENARNASRIIGEDTEALIFNEHLNAADRYATAAVVAEAVGAGDGVKKIFVLANFPVVRPRKDYDLAGVQVGATLYGITITVNAVNRPEYDGTGGQAAGIYWTMNYNLGEINFVNELGVATAVTNTHAILCTYTYTTNVAKWDSDLGALAVDAKWDDFLYQFGLRKAVIEDQRFYQADVAINSGTLRTQIERAKQFAGQPFGPKPGNTLSAEGNLGMIKGVPNFKSTAPGLGIGDVRCVIGQRETVRFRMMKPWQMNALENQKDANGRFTGKKEAYGDQYLVVDTPTPLRAALTSVAVYSTAARVNR